MNDWPIAAFFIACLIGLVSIIGYAVYLVNECSLAGINHGMSAIEIMAVCK